MKKILTQIIAFCLLFSLTACSSKANQDDVVTVFNAFNKTLNADSGTLSGTIYYKTENENEIDFNIDFIQTGNLQIKANVDLTSNGNTAKDYLQFYVKDGKTYMNNLGTTSQSLLENIGLNPKNKISIYNPFLDFTDKQLTAFFKSSSKNGNTYTLEMDTKGLATLLDAMGNLSISKGEIQATVENDSITELKLIITAYMAYNDISSDVDIEINCKVENYNSLETIEFPKDLEKY